MQQVWKRCASEPLVGPDLGRCDKCGLAGVAPALLRGLTGPVWKANEQVRRCCAILAHGVFGNWIESRLQAVGRQNWLKAGLPSRTQFVSRIFSNTRSERR